MLDSVNHRILVNEVLFIAMPLITKKI
jgi:hypothetical protein